MSNFVPLVLDSANLQIVELPAGDYLELDSSGVSNLAVANLQLLGGSNGQVLTTDGAGNLSWASGGSGSGDRISNGTSMVSIPTLNGPVLVDVSGVSNVAVYNSSNVTFSVDVIGATEISAPTFTATGQVHTPVVKHTSGALLLQSTGSGSNIDIQPGSGGVVDVHNHLISNVATPISSQDAANKAYVDALVQGLMPKDSVEVATLVNLTATYNNGASGIGATLTLGSPLTTLDGYTLNIGDRVLVKNQTLPAENGIYTYDSSTLLTRATDSDTISELDEGSFYFVLHGTVGAGNGYVQITTIATIGTDAITYSQVSTATAYSAGNNISIVGTTISLANNVSVAGNLTVASNANIIIGGGSNNQILSTNGSGNLSWVNPYIETSEFGQVVQGANVALTVGSSATATTLMTFTLPSAGTWRVTYTMHGYGGGTSGGTYAVYDNTGTLVANSEIRGVYTTTGLVGSGTAGVVIVTTTGAATYTIRGWAQTAGSNSLSYADGRSKVVYEKIGGYQPALFATDWTTGTTTIGAVTTAPTKGTIVTDIFRYRQVGAKEYDIDFRFWQSTAGTAGSGDYLFSLPSGLSWNATYAVYTGAVAASVFGYGIPVYGMASSLGTYMFNGIFIVPYDSTRYRVCYTESSTTVRTLNSNSATSMTMGQANINLKWRFSFTAA